MAISMRKTQSQPTVGLMGLGIEMPRSNLPGTNLKKSTFRFRFDGEVNDLHNHEALRASDSAVKMAEQMKNHPSWRLVASQMGLTAENARTGPMGVDDHPPGIHDNMKWPRVTPAWLKHDKQVLRFYAFFQEHVSERPDENARYRQCVLMYFMEDGTIRISEPRQENSGIPQGQFLKRHRVPKADGSGLLGPGDFRVGEDIVIYGRRFHVTGADRFTRWFFEENGIDLGPDEPAVEDMWERNYKVTKTAEKGGLAVSRNVVEAKHMNASVLGCPPPGRALTQFLENDCKVLRLYAYWDDPTLYGARTYAKVHFFLADNTMEVNEMHSRNSGRDNYPNLLKRAPLYKENSVSVYPGMLAADPQPYLPEDLLVGTTFKVWGRVFLIYDCDDFTREFYKDYMGIDQKDAIIDVETPPIKHVTLPPPPHCGPGREEDSVINCKMIQPKQPKQDLEKMMKLTGEILRFEAKMVTGQPEDECRRLIVMYFPADDEVMVTELVQRNSGFTGGRFAAKKRIKNPDTGVYFTLADLAVGKYVNIKSHPMLIIRADERCLQWCESHPEDFPYADPMLVANKLAPLRDEPQLQDPGGTDPDLIKYLAPQVGVELIDHEIITLIRFFGMDETEGVAKISWEKVKACMGQ
jgi:hypothetical protein